MAKFELEDIEPTTEIRYPQVSVTLVEEKSNTGEGALLIHHNNLEALDVLHMLEFAAIYTYNNMLNDEERAIYESEDEDDD